MSVCFVSARGCSLLVELLIINVLCLVLVAALTNEVLSYALFLFFGYLTDFFKFQIRGNVHDFSFNVELRDQAITTHLVFLRNQKIN